MKNHSNATRFHKRMKKLVAMLVLCMALLAACETTPGAVNSLATDTPSLPVATEETPSQPPAAATVTPTVASPSPTLEPTTSPTTTASQTEQPGESLSGLEIDLSNVANLQISSSLSAAGGSKIAWANGGQALAVGAEEGVLLFDLEQTDPPLEGEELSPVGVGNQLVSSPQASLIAWVGTDYSVQVWDGDAQTISGISGEVVSMAFSTDESLLAAGSVDNQLYLWEVPSGSPVNTWELDIVPTNLSFSPDDARLAAVDQNSFSVHIYDVASGEELQFLEWTEHASPVLYGATFSPDWTTLAWWSRGTVQLMDVETGEFGHDLGHEDFLTDIAWAPNGSLIATAAAGTVDGNFTPLVSLWDASTGELVKPLSLQNPALDVAFSPDGTQLAVLDSAGEVQLFSVAP